MNRALRERIINYIITELKTVDYTQQIKDYLNNDAKTQLKEDLGIGEEEYKRLRPYLGENYVYECRHYVFNNLYKLGEDTKKRIEQMVSLRKEQDDTLRAIRHTLYAVLGSCTTVGQALKRLPEFGKQITLVTGVFKNETTKALPATTDLFDNLKKLGWENES